jgi:hypothetical protein
VAVDVERTAYLVREVFRYGRLLEGDTLALDPSARQVAMSLAGPLLELAQVAVEGGDAAQAAVYLRRAYLLSPSPPLRDILTQIESGGVERLRQVAPDPLRVP